MNINIFGMDLYRLALCFVMYSVLGWFVESVYMSFCEHKLTNRGFGKGPFCPIYGFGALGAVILFTPLKGNVIAIYLMGCVVATAFEYLVGVAMIRFLGDLWWDYSNKPFNYKGILCLESTLAWGVYAVGIVYFIQGWFLSFINGLDYRLGCAILMIAFMVVSVDYIIQLRKVFEHH